MQDPIVDEIERMLQERQAEARELHHRHVNPGAVEELYRAGYGRSFVRAEGLELEDAGGRRYLDFLSGYGVLNLGHNHPTVRAALEAVLARKVPGFLQVDLGLLEGLAAQRLVAALGGELDKVFFCQSGTEAVEAGLKLARAATGRVRFVACEGAFHGLTLGALSLNGNADRIRPFGPLLRDVSRVPFGDLGPLERALRARDVAAFVVEPILGEGGAITPPAGYLRAAAELCHRHGALFVVDEVQTGIGRTGHLLAIEHEGVRPDAVALAKALGGGLMPVGALVARGDVFMRAYGTAKTCRLHSNTFGGNPLAMAAVISTLAVLDRDRLIENAAEQGAYLKAGLDRLQKRHRAVRAVHGRGLMLGLELAELAPGLLGIGPLKRLGQATSWIMAQYVAHALIEDHAIVTQAALNREGVLKVMPPLSVTRAAVDRFTAALDTVLDGVGHGRAIGSMIAMVAKQRRASPG